ncbi:MAG: insulinase family protein [Bdellovibrionales bacterium]|nr:insulinase family protein [Bdellovibrionales bacterium]
MARVSSRFITACGFLLLAACRTEVSSLGVKVSLEEHRLSNGLRVILVEDHTVPTISYQTWYKVGSRDEVPGMTGLAHLFEHLMFKGTDRYGPKSFFDLLEARGAEVNAFTTRDYTSYYVNTVPALLDQIIDLESDRMTGLKLDDTTLASERMVVLEERKLRIDSQPVGLMQEAIWALAFRRHPYHWPVIGMPEDIISVPAEKIREFYRRYYHPGNAILVVAGDFKPDELFEKIKKAYGKIPRGQETERTKITEFEQNEERRLNLYDEVASEKFAHAYPIPSAHEEDAYALDILATILFAGSQSRAHRDLVEEKKLTSDVAGVAYTPNEPGLFLISASMRTGHSATEAEEKLNALIRDVQENGVTQEEIEKAVKQLTLQAIENLKTHSGTATLIGTVTTILEKPERYADDLAKYTKVSREDVQRVAETYLQPNKRSVVVLYPESKRPKPEVKADVSKKEKPKATVKKRARKKGTTS